LHAMIHPQLMEQKTKAVTGKAASPGERPAAYHTIITPDR